MWLVIVADNVGVSLLSAWIRATTFIPNPTLGSVANPASLSSPKANGSKAAKSASVVVASTTAGSASTSANNVVNKQVKMSGGGSPESSNASLPLPISSSFDQMQSKGHIWLLLPLAVQLMGCQYGLLKSSARELVGYVFVAAVIGDM